jgi:glucosamine--fructose-6-phosphate aminotransferase (isomerizing)
MLKEIHEQPRAIEDTLRGRSTSSRATSSRARSASTAATRRPSSACISSRAAPATTPRWRGATGSSTLARVPATVASWRASSAGAIPWSARGRPRHRRQPVGRDARHPRRRQEGREGRRAPACSPSPTSSTAPSRAADGTLYTHAGPEIGVASTKCFTAQLGDLLLAVYLGRSAAPLARARARELLEGWSRSRTHARRAQRAPTTAGGAISPAPLPGAKTCSSSAAA